MQQTIDFDGVLENILTILSFDEEDKKELLDQFHTLSLRTAIVLLLEIIGKKDNESTENLRKLIPQLELRQISLNGLLKESLKVLTEEEITTVFYDSKSSVFVELLIPIVENTNDEERSRIAQEISKDKELAQLLTSNMPQQAKPEKS